jgi:hypothetical protein
MSESMQTFAAEGSPLLAYDSLCVDVPEPAGGLCTIICRALCCGGKNASHVDPSRVFPRTPSEFAVTGVGWVNSVMAARLGSNRCTKVEVGELGAEGLLSELCMATLTYATADSSLPTEVVVKFSPAELKTQVRSLRSLFPPCFPLRLGAHVAVNGTADDEHLPPLQGRVSSLHTVSRDPAGKHQDTDLLRRRLQLHLQQSAFILSSHSSTVAAESGLSRRRCAHHSDLLPLTARCGCTCQCRPA